ncbi:AraC family transcriptional regulator [Paenibacillus roseipurpureus]|uniref:AraC family transcriptional regulator n=1 Tax=Paenibacillus roseopurpureus TaxID=2918901 RepID=A0AA96LJ55_9BACL|nr:AraC family transcriptional regulator [Paenibacillus sp. MBLB1832]WNR42812.1 AraC family transcriptional regulator [Paenibacillus sp. MBLB1832]
MNYEFLNRFSPKLLDVVERNAEYWDKFNYQLLREHTLLHSLAYVHAGEGTLRVGEGIRPLLPGTVFQIWPGQRMQIDTDRLKPVCFYSVHFQYGLLHWEGVKGEWREACGPLPIGDHLNLLSNPEVEDVFLRMFQDWKHKHAGYEWQVRVGFLEALRLIVAADAKEIATKEEGSAAAVREAISYIKANLHENVTRDDMAQHVTLSPAYFSSLFKKHTGTSPIQYLTRLRLDQAKHLLRQTELPIKQVAEAVGFEDSFYFTRLFTKETGISPRNYRHA